MHGIRITGNKHCILECINMVLWIGGPVVKFQMNRRSIRRRHEFEHNELDEWMARVMTSFRLYVVRMTRLV